ncbi:MAG TPA: NAD(P)/FAD-dependent oxidoreductase [Oscillatoriaceae cyanobacterium]
MPEGQHEVAIVGGGYAGLSAAIYLGRAMRDVVIIDAGHSMGNWEPEVQNYLGFPEGISGEALVERGLEQAQEYGARWAADTIERVEGGLDDFVLHGLKGDYRARRLLLATGAFHLPPAIAGTRRCIGYSVFFCKDCDGYRVRGKAVAIAGNRNEAVHYALGMLAYSPKVYIVTNGEEPMWDDQHEAWRREYGIPYHCGRIEGCIEQERMIKAIDFEGGRRIRADVIFATRGDVFHNQLARALGAAVDREGQILVDVDGRTSVPGLYAAGCVTPANCQMIIAAGQGATAAQAINADLLAESLEKHTLRRYREIQCRDGGAWPEVME